MPENLYSLMIEYAAAKRIKPDLESPTPELGHDLTLFHACLLETGLAQEDVSGYRRISASPRDLIPSHLSRFLIGFLPYNDNLTQKNQINLILFELYCFLKWLEKKNIPHGLSNIDFRQLVRNLFSDMDRCRRLSRMLDEEAGKILNTTPPLQQTVNDIFSVVKIESDFILLKGASQTNLVRINLPLDILRLVKPNDKLDLVLGDTSEKWAILEAGVVFPGCETTDG